MQYGQRVSEREVDVDGKRHQYQQWHHIIVSGLCELVADAAAVSLGESEHPRLQLQPWDTALPCLSL